MNERLQTSNVDKQAAILIVEDDPGIRRGLADGLSDSGYMVVTAATAEDALTRLSVVSVDLALIDLKLPGLSGVELLRQLRQSSPNTVAVIITANPSTNSAIEALRLDAFDYLLKPFTLDQVEDTVQRGLEQRRQRLEREMLLRQLERSVSGLQALQPSGKSGVMATAAPPPPPEKPWLLTCGNIEIDLQRHVVHVNGESADLTPTEFNMLVTLADRAPAVVSPETLIRQATGYQADPGEARDLVKWHIHHLRRKIEKSPRKPRYILNVRGVGYRLSNE
jgi:DNA-binding response OmpR family regulator